MCYIVIPYARLGMCESPEIAYLVHGYMIEITLSSLNKSLVLLEKINIISRIPS